MLGKGAVRRRLVVLMVVAASVCPTTWARAGATLVVPVSYPTIQAAIDAAANGDVVRVQPGFYPENIDLRGKAIVVHSEEGPEQTIIDGQSRAPVVTIRNDETPATKLIGFTIQHGRATYDSGYSGGGVNIVAASPVIEGNHILDNRACSNGAGVAIAEGSPIIRGNRISGNHQAGCSGGPGGGGIAALGGAPRILGNTISDNSWGTSGGGVTVWASDAMVRDNVFDANSAGGDGGALWTVNDSNATITQNIFTRNVASRGAAYAMSVPSYSDGPSFVNNTVVENTGPAVLAFGFYDDIVVQNNILFDTSGDQAIVCDTIYGNYVPDVSFNDFFAPGAPVACGQSGSGNVVADPLFVDVATHDFHLNSGSPAIDAGNNTAPALPGADLDGMIRVANGRVDLGVYETSSEPWTADTTPPVITSTVTPPPNHHGWHRSPVDVSFAVFDLESGIGSTSGCEPTSIDHETAGTDLECAAMNGDGYDSTATVTVRLDMTPPTMEFADHTPEPNEFGWNNGPVTVTYSCLDELSGTPEPFVQYAAQGEGENISGELPCQDFAGNETSVIVDGINVDLSPPTIEAYAAPVVLSVHGAGSISGEASDATSGVHSIMVTFTHRVSGETSTRRALCEGCGDNGNVSWLVSTAGIPTGPTTVVAVATDLAGHRKPTYFDSVIV